MVCHSAPKLLLHSLQYRSMKSTGPQRPSHNSRLESSVEVEAGDSDEYHQHLREIEDQLESPSALKTPEAQQTP